MIFLEKDYLNTRWQVNIPVANLSSYLFRGFGVGHNIYDLTISVYVYCITTRHIGTESAADPCAPM